MPSFPITSSTVDWSRSCSVFPGVLILQESSCGIPRRRNQVVPFRRRSPEFVVILAPPAKFVSVEQPLRISVSHCTFRACSRGLAPCVARPRVRSPSAAAVRTHRGNAGVLFAGAPPRNDFSRCSSSNNSSRASGEAP
jgi:hypothetical protein